MSKGKKISEADYCAVMVACNRLREAKSNLTAACAAFRKAGIEASVDNGNQSMLHMSQVEYAVEDFLRDEFTLTRYTL